MPFTQYFLAFFLLLCSTSQISDPLSENRHSWPEKFSHGFWFFFSFCSLVRRLYGQMERQVNEQNSWRPHGKQSVKPKFHYANFATFTETSPWGKSRTQIMKVRVRTTNHVADFHDLCPRQSPGTLSRTCHRHCRKHLDMSRWFVSMTFPAGKLRRKST